METIKCTICGRIFKPRNAASRYCSKECRDAARNAYKRQKRAEEAADRGQDAEKARLRRVAESQERLRHSRQTRQAQIEAGDPMAVMLEALKNGNTSIEYWRAYQAYALAEAERSSSSSDQTVNGYSVHDPDFAALVVDSIDINGTIITERRLI